MSSFNSGDTRFISFIYFERLSLKMGGRFVYLVVDSIDLLKCDFDQEETSCCN